MKRHAEVVATGEQKSDAELDGRVALVTGASRGIGRAIALAPARAGADVAVNCHAHADEARAVCSEIERLGRRALPVQANVASAAEVAQMVESVERQLGGTDILVNNAGNINSYYDDPHDATGRFDFVLANPPFNGNAADTAMRVSARRHPEGTPQDLPARQDHERLKDMVGPGRRFPFGLARTDNANFLWIQLFHSALNGKGMAGFVMANCASDVQTSTRPMPR